ncbi:SLBB domain-containing protein [bacterium]|nr:SLBB domain-containing protein [bacterium]
MKKFMPFFLILIFILIGFTNIHGAELQIKPGNIVHITVLGYPELSKSVLVREDGNTDYPLLANVPIDGMTVHQLQEALQPILVRFVERPKLFINIAEHIQFDITIEGQVARPGPYTVKGPINLQGVLSIAGGTSQLADLRNVTISRRDFEAQRDIVVNLHQFFVDPENAALPEIQDGDIIFVPIISSASTVRVMGAVQSPGTYNPLKDNNIADMIYKAGGPRSNGNLHSVIYISIHDGKHKSELIDIETLINNGKTHQIPLVHPGDVIVVRENNWWQERSWWVSLLRDVALVLSSIVIISRL